jgi:hypothetical protein
MAIHPLVGVWRLVSCETHGDTGTTTYPFGPSAQGYIMYTADGYFSVGLMSRDRRPFAAGDMTKATDEERQEALQTYLSYAGAYEVMGDTVLHHVEISLFPNWTGGDQKRFYTVAGDHLTVWTPPLLRGGVVQSLYLTLDRA